MSGTAHMLISSTRVEEGHHDRVTVWNRGGNAGTLTVRKGDGAEVAARLLGGRELEKALEGANADVMAKSAGECPKCRGPLSRDGSHYFCDACRVNAKCQRAACLVEEWRVGGYCSTDCAALAEVEEERDAALARVAELEELLAAVRAEALEEAAQACDAMGGAVSAVGPTHTAGIRDGVAICVTRIRALKVTP